MTKEEKQLVEALLNCKFSYGRYKDRQVLSRIQKEDHTLAGDMRTLVISLGHRFRRQIPNYETLSAVLKKKP